MKQKTLGIIGGLGPETSCKFCLNINLKVKSETDVQPHILLDNLPISGESENKLINGGISDEHLNLLKDSIVRIQNNVDFIVIPCNTVHIFIDQLRMISNVPIISIIEGTINECKRLKLNKVGLLASTKTVKENLHGKELQKEGISLIVPNNLDQSFISECIVRIINQKIKNTDKKKLLEIMNKLVKQGADGIILGCTDLPLLVNQLLLDVPLINTTEVLENIAVKLITE